LRRISVSPIAFATAAATILSCAALAYAASSTVKLVKVSSDPYRNRTSFHATEVEPDTFAHGKTVVAAFQVGRFADGGADDIGWARFAGGRWTHGFLPGTTAHSTPKGAFARASDPAVAYDAKHQTWLISGLALSAGLDGAAVLVNRSTDGARTWSSPVTVATATSGQSFDKEWIVCDNTSTSPHYGNCYAEWDDAGNADQLHMAYSSDGGSTWTEATVPAAGVIGGQPVVLPDGHVVVPIDDAFNTIVESFVSTDGGLSYSGPTTISTVSNHLDAGELRSPPLPSATVDGSGRVYVAWADCRFRPTCRANDIVYASSTDGTHWSTVQRVPVDPTSSPVDHFLPGIDAGSSGKLSLVYYYYPHTNCLVSTCRLDVGFTSSADGGTTWSSPLKLAGPMRINSLPLTTQGYMVGDYSSSSLLTSVTGEPATSVFAVGLPVAHKVCASGRSLSCDEPMEAPARRLPTAGAAALKTVAAPVLSTRSDHRATKRLTYR
jgi:hypothetical protein